MQLGSFKETCSSEQLKVELNYSVSWHEAELCSAAVAATRIRRMKNASPPQPPARVVSAVSCHVFSRIFQGLSKISEFCADFQFFN